MNLQTRALIPGAIQDIILWSRRRPTRIGYFAALYSHVAAALHHELHIKGSFQHRQLMESLNSRFFHRYAAAVHHHRRCESTTKAWSVAFEAAPDEGLIVVQHLLLGINAHVNLDLAVAVAETVPIGSMVAFQPDFERLNQVLGLCVKGVIRDIARVWPLLGLISRIDGGAEDAMIRFSLTAAREDAWNEAQKLAALSPRARENAIRALDGQVAAFAQTILEPGLLFKPVIQLIRLTESGGIRAIIDDILG